MKTVPALLLSALLLLPTLRAAVPPPVQAEWTPPETKLPPEYVSTVKLLLGNALADPRGGEFHRFKARIGDAAWGFQQTEGREAFGWLLPGGKHFVGVDGLAYEFTEDLGATSIEKFLGAEEDKFDGRAVPVNVWTIAVPGLLLVRGEVALAESAMGRVSVNDRDSPAKGLCDLLAERYRMQAAQCLKVRDDQGARDWAEKWVHAASARSKAPTKNEQTAKYWQTDLADAERVYEDCARRAANPKPPVEVEKIRQLEPPARIAAWLEALDEVAAQQSGQPGGIDWSWDPFVTAVVGEGEVMVPALLDAMEKDRRVTRSVSFHRDFFPHRKIHTVREAAWAILRRIWPVAATQVDHGVPEDLAGLRKLWDDTKGLDPQQRWLEVLRNDAAQPKDWLEAARALTKKEPYNPSRATESHMIGESLRGKHGEEVTQLLTRRAAGILPKDDPFSAHDYWAYQVRLDLVRCLYKWAPDQALAPLREASAGIAPFMKKAYNDQGWHSLGRSYAIVLRNRLEAGDDGALEDYRAFLMHGPAREHFNEDHLSLLWRRPADERAQAVGTEFFARFQEELTKDLGKETGRGTYDFKTCRGAVMLSPAYRKYVAELTESELDWGTAKYNGRADNPGIDTKLKGVSGGAGLPKGVDLGALSREDVPVVLGDVAAAQVSHFPQAPTYVMVAPPAERAAARKKVAAWLLDPKVDWAGLLKDEWYMTMEPD
jgi:hypothetical protein